MWLGQKPQEFRAAAVEKQDMLEGSERATSSAPHRKDGTELSFSELPVRPGGTSEARPWQTGLSPP